MSNWLDNIRISSPNNIVTINRNILNTTGEKMKDLSKEQAYLVIDLYGSDHPFFTCKKEGLISSLERKITVDQDDSQIEVSRYRVYKFPEMKQVKRADIKIVCHDAKDE